MKLKHLIFSALFLFSIISCSIKLTPHYSQDAVTQVETLGHDLDSFYDGEIASSDKSYAPVEGRYQQINTEMTGLLTLYATRQNNKTITGFLKDMQGRFAGYQSDHRQAGSLNNAQFLVRKNGMHALWASLHNSEINFKPEKQK